MLRKISIGKYVFFVIFALLSFFKFFTLVVSSNTSDISAMVFSYKPILANRVSTADLASYITNNNFKIISEGSIDTFTPYELAYTLWRILFIVVLIYIVLKKVK